MKEQKTWIECELDVAPADHKQFHLIEMKTGKGKVVAFGNIFPLKGSKKFLNELKKELGIKITNEIDFYRDVRTMIKLGLM